MHRHSPMRIIILIVLLIILVAMVYIFSEMLDSARQLTEKQKQTSQITVAQPGGQNLTSANTTREKTPFILVLEHKDIDNVIYTTFSVYRKTVSTESRLYICGRSFETSLLRSIDWASDSFDIVVTYKNGQELIFGFDGNDGWQ